MFQLYASADIDSNPRIRRSPTRCTSGRPRGSLRAAARHSDRPAVPAFLPPLEILSWKKHTTQRSNIFMVGHPTNSGRLFNIHGLERLYRTSINYVIYSLECIYTCVYMCVYICMSVYICIYKIVKTIKCLNNWEQGSDRRMESEWNLTKS